MVTPIHAIMHSTAVKKNADRNMLASHVGLSEEVFSKVLADAYGITLNRLRPTGVIPLKTLRAGLEPATYGLEDRCSIQLSYRSMGWALYASQGIMPTLGHVLVWLQGR